MDWQMSELQLGKEYLSMINPKFRGVLMSLYDWQRLARLRLHDGVDIIVPQQSLIDGRVLETSKAEARAKKREEAKRVRDEAIADYRKSLEPIYEILLTAVAESISKKEMQRRTGYGKRFVNSRLMELWQQGKIEQSTGYWKVVEEQHE